MTGLEGTNDCVKISLRESGHPGAKEIEAYGVVLEVQVKESVRVADRGKPKAVF